MKTCFSEGKLMKQFDLPPFLREDPPPPHLSTNPLFLTNFFMTTSLSKFQKRENSPNFFWGGGEGQGGGVWQETMLDQKKFLKEVAFSIAVSMNANTENSQIKHCPFPKCLVIYRPDLYNLQAKKTIGKITKN